MKLSGMSFYGDMFSCLVVAAMRDLVAMCWASDQKKKKKTQTHYDCCPNCRTCTCIQLKDARAKIFQSKEFFRLLLQADNDVLVPEIVQKKLGSPSSFQRKSVL